jgi:hypothetical protein
MEAEMVPLARLVSTRSLLTLTAVLLLAACGGEQAQTDGEAAPAAEAPAAPVDDEAAVGNVVTTYLNALAARDYATACAQLSPQAQEEVLALAESSGVGGGSCQEAIAGAFGTLSDQELADLRDVPVTAVQIEGDSATAEIQGGTAPIPLTRSNRGWVISEFPKA